MFVAAKSWVAKIQIRGGNPRLVTTIFVQRYENRSRPRRSCATITRGSSQQFSITSQPSGATAKRSTGQLCTTPCTLFDIKRKNAFDVTFSKEGYQDKIAKVVSVQAGAGTVGFVGNAMVGGPIGAV